MKKMVLSLKTSKFYEPEIELFKNIIDYCKLNNLTLEVSPKNGFDDNEFKFFKNIEKFSNLFIIKILIKIC